MDGAKVPSKPVGWMYKDELWSSDGLEARGRQVWRIAWLEDLVGSPYCAKDARS